MRRRGTTNLWCDFCGHFINTAWAVEQNQFSGESTEFCRACSLDMPADHRERQEWQVRNLP